MMLDPVEPYLDVLVAATLSAWFLGLASPRSAEHAARRMTEMASRVQIGALAVATGLFVELAALVVRLVGQSAPAEIMGFLSYPFLIGGAVMLASSTWKERRETAVAS